MKEKLSIKERMEKDEYFWIKVFLFALIIIGIVGAVISIFADYSELINDYLTYGSIKNISDY